MARGPRNDPYTQKLLAKFASWPVGRSFFVRGAARADLEFLRRPAVKLGVGIRIVQVTRDPIHNQPGVRVWREEGSYDEI